MSSERMLFSTMLSAATTHEIAAILGLSHGHVCRLVREKRLLSTKVKMPGKPRRTMIPGWAVMLYQCADLAVLLRRMMDEGETSQTRDITNP